MRKGLATPKHTLASLHLSCSGLSATVVARLLSKFGSPQAVTDASRGSLLQSGFSESTAKKICQPRLDLVERALAWSGQSGNHLIDIASEKYPPLLKEIPDPPPLLYVTGEPELLGRPQLAIVGSRKATPTARAMSREIAATLSASGLSVCSGLAHGIDCAAHEGALSSDNLTVAVLGTGTDRCYPSANRRLYQEIATKAALVSEFPPGTPPLAANFPRRNRIISGLSLGTLVIEATARSGTLITARLAMEQNREVFAVPGSVLNPLSHGCHQLIRQGAKLVENTQDILEELDMEQWLQLSPVENRSQCTQDRNAAARTDAALLRDIGFDPITLDQLCEQTGRSASELLPELLTLELNGVISTLNGGRYIRC